MKLYYMPGACSLSPHIALREAGLDFQLVRVGRDKRTADGRDFREINPFGYVPALELPTGEVLLEGPAIVQYIAWLVGEHFGVADAYLYVVTSWLAHFDIDIGRWPKLAAHNARVANRPAVQAARRAEKDPGRTA